MRPLFKHQVLGKYMVQYFTCGGCGLIQTQEPFWLAEAYSSPISQLDTWGGTRNVINAHRLSRILSVLFKREDSFIDTACGYGLFVRLMRDRGFDFHGHDEYCPNLFSRNLPPMRNLQPAALTCFEVLEHVTDPINFIKNLLLKYSTDTIIASTTTYEGPIPELSWPYYSFESGQHVSIYNALSLKTVAAKLGLDYVKLDVDLHLFSSRTFHPFLLKLIRLRRFRTVVGWTTALLRKTRSLTYSDYEFIRRGIAQS